MTLCTVSMATGGAGGRGGDSGAGLFCLWEREKKIGIGASVDSREGREQSRTRLCTHPQKLALAHIHNGTIYALVSALIRSWVANARAHAFAHKATIAPAIGGKGRSRGGLARGGLAEL